MRRNVSRHPITIISLGLALSASLAACGGGGGGNDDAKRPSDPAAAKLFDKAVDEPGVYVYSNFQENINADLEKGWKAKIGTKLTIEKVASASVNARYESEADASAVKADIVINSDCDFIRAQIKKGTMISALDAGIPDYPGDIAKTHLFDDGAIPVAQLNPWGIGYNTKNVDEADAPKQWEDLLDPKWKGKILMVGPDSGASQVQIWDVLDRKFGDDFVKKLVAQKAQFYPSTGPAAEALAAGEGDILIPTAGQVTNSVVVAGGPAAFNLPDDTSASTICVGLSKNAKSPNAARLFLSACRGL